MTNYTERGNVNIVCKRGGDMERQLRSGNLNRYLKEMMRCLASVARPRYIEPPYLRNPLFDFQKFLYGLSLGIYLKDSQVWLKSDEKKFRPFF